MNPLHRKTLRPLAGLICGDHGPVYRKGYELPRFFREADLECEDHDGSTRADWTEARLHEYNQDPDQMLKIVKHLADPREYTGNPQALQDAVGSLNQILALEGLRVLIKGTVAHVQVVEPAILPPQTTTVVEKSALRVPTPSDPTTADLLEQAESFKYLLLASAQNNDRDPPEMEQSYRELRRKLLAVPRLKLYLPAFLRSCRDLGDFWHHRLSIAGAESAEVYIRVSLEPLLAFLENDLFAPSDPTTADTITTFTPDHIRETWRKALERRLSDPEAAITSARTLLESVCKFILDEQGQTYEDSADLPKLYRLTATQLNLAPDQHTEDIFKRILGGCQTIAEGLGALRNRLSDAHGKGRLPVKPSVRHATLAVNLAGTMAAFLIETYEVQKNK